MVERKKELLRYSIEGENNNSPNCFMIYYPAADFNFRFSIKLLFLNAPPRREPCGNEWPIKQKASAAVFLS